MERVNNYFGLKRGSVIQHVGRIVFVFYKFHVFYFTFNFEIIGINFNISIFYRLTTVFVIFFY